MDESFGVVQPLVRVSSEVISLSLWMEEVKRLKEGKRGDIGRRQERAGVPGR